MSSRLARHRVDRLGMVEVALLELARLLVRRAPEDAEHHPERVERGQQRAERARPRRATSSRRRARPRRRGSRPSRSSPRSPGKRAERERRDEEGGEGERHRAPQARDAVDVLLAGHRRDHRAGRHEHQRLEEGVGHQMEEPRAVGGDRDADDHVADLADRRVGDDPLQVGDDQRDRSREQERERADRGRDVGGGRRQLEQRVRARDQVDAGGHHRGGVDQRGDRRRALHRVRRARCGAGAAPTSRTRRRGSAGRSRRSATRSG